MISPGSLYDEMEKHFGSFGRTCWRLAVLRESEGLTDNELVERFETACGKHRKCFNKNGFIASCREPE